MLDTDTVRLVTLDPAMAKRLAKAGEAVRKRDELIVEASNAGASLREIGRAVGLTHVAVKKIIDKHR